MTVDKLDTIIGAGTAGDIHSLGTIRQTYTKREFVFVDGSWAAEGVMTMVNRKTRRLHFASVHEFMWVRLL